MPGPTQLARPLPPTVPYPAWLDPKGDRTADVPAIPGLMMPGQGFLRDLVGMLGLDDPQQIMAIGAPIEVGPMTGGAIEALAGRFPRFAAAISRIGYHGTHTPGTRAPGHPAPPPIEVPAGGLPTARTWDAAAQTLPAPVPKSLRPSPVPPSHLPYAPAARLNGPESPLIISTRVPGGKDALLATDGRPLITDMSVVYNDPELMEKFANKIRTYPQLTNAEKRMNDRGVVDAFVARGAKNLEFLWQEVQKTQPGDLARGRDWFNGAHRLAVEDAGAVGVSKEQGAAVLASLSPTKDWYMNAELSKRTMNGWLQHSNDNTLFTPELFEAYRTSSLESAQRKLSGIARDKGDQAALRFWQEAQYRLAIEKPQLVGRAWHDLELPGQARLLRTYSQLHEPAAYPMILPEGERVGSIQTGKGKDAKISWQSFDILENALSILHDGSPENISRRLGTEHKVRSFYTNIVDPSYRPASTMDTHAVSAHHLEPLSLEAPAVKYAMGGASSAKTGISGANPVYNESYQQVAHAVDALPREVQSVDWEAVRGLFSPAQKADEDFVSTINGLWKEHAKGKLSEQKLYDAILNEAGGINRPTWAHTPAGQAAK